jgi:hypothetical protein
LQEVIRQDLHQLQGLLLGLLERQAQQLQLKMMELSIQQLALPLLH